MSKKNPAYDGDAIKTRLYEIYNRDGVLTPQAVVDEATNPASPLHVAFDWDDTSAAAKYRLIQAGRLIKRIKVTREELTEHRVTCAFVDTSDTDAREYHEYEVVRQDPELSARAVARARREMEATRRRYESLCELLPIAQEVYGRAA